MASTKTGSAGRFGVRYSRKIREKVSEIEKKSRSLHKCPYCNKIKVKRVFAGIWQCKSCNNKFAGKAYTPY
ncbi:50S ribosomal protein L37ae [archaeon]|jgi:large subunit ribosomal protein L37Ae|nr:50S ribosomal protein L37ae [archaeon]|tara:strand:+ start:929 stop:1141 length:213 start_codon:yes stop_codon:yes gene_type:complete